MQEMLKAEIYPENFPWWLFFKGRNLRDFPVFGCNSREFIPWEISNQLNAKDFSREIIDNFKSVKFLFIFKFNF